jgi:hypothetical protein
MQHRIATVSEAVCQQVLTRADAFTAVESVFAAMARGEARNFPVVREALGFTASNPAMMRRVVFWGSNQAATGPAMPQRV